jgi:hypothetical protein
MTAREYIDDQLFLQLAKDEAQLTSILQLYYPARQGYLNQLNHR